MKKNKPEVGAAVAVKPGEKVQLKAIDPGAKPELDKGEAKLRTERDAKAIDELQNRLYAEGTRALLVILQGTDTSGKDGTIRAVFNYTGPVGVQVTSFKAPNSDELSRDYLWRVHKAVPARGMIGIFNRSHYEDVLIVKVKRLVPAEAVEARYEQINQFEKHLVENGTTIIKLMLHISREEQKKRFEERVVNPRKQWKFNPADVEDRKLWDEYEAAYEAMLQRCSTELAPWHVIPADRNWVRNWTVAQIVRQTLEKMNPQFPKRQWTAADVKID
jgi:PPK2 family polyphosphate:nucleotide phosphotransferase